MLVLGLILVLVSVAALVAALIGGSNDPATFDLGIFDVQTNTLGVFLIGAVTVLLFVVGLGLARTGIRRGNRRRRERKEYQRLSERYADDKPAAQSERPIESSQAPEAPSSSTGADPE